MKTALKSSLKTTKSWYSGESYQDIDCQITLPTPLRLEYGLFDFPVSVRARLVGPVKAPVFCVLGGISANRFVSPNPETQQSGWWSALCGPEKTLDTRKFRILSFEFFPSDAEATALNLPVTPTDQARIAAVICNYFGIKQLAAFIGASYGGMVALSFGELFPERVQELLVLCAAHHPDPLGSAWRSIQRKILRFGMETQQPDRALSLARELGMTTYRTSQEFRQRFSDRTELEAYLQSQGRAFIGRMSPERYLALSESIDLHHVDPKQIHVPVTVVGFTHDQLVPIESITDLYDALPMKKQCYTHHSLYGHDAFLKEIPYLESIFRQVILAHHTIGTR